MFPTLRRRLVVTVAAALALVGAPAVVVSAGAAPAPSGVRNACATAAAGTFRCFAQYVSIPAGTAAPAASHAVSPADLLDAYNVPAGAGAGRTVAIVDAYDNPKAESDLAKFRAKWGLPACTTANGCFRKVNQGGNAAPLPQADEGWGLEIALDLDAVSSLCPKCHILLVEGFSSSLDSLGRAVNTAVKLGADVVSNSYGADEFPGMKAYGDKYYVHPGVPIVASTGDFGFTAASFPAVLTTSIAAGGTRLLPDSSARGWTEKAWSGAGSGCSAYIAKPSWQHDANCLYRVNGDLSADADPATGLVVSDSFGFPGHVLVGGTSLAAPLISAMYALSANPSSVDDASYAYAHAGQFNDVVGGSNGYCGRDYLCTGVVGYDGPTGIGTPNGVGGLS